MTQRIHLENADWLSRLYADLPHHDRGKALTGKLNADGISTNPNTTEGLPPRYMWVRTEAYRTGTRALIGPGMFAHYRRYDSRIWVGSNDVGELVAIEPITDGVTAAMELDEPYNDPAGRGDPLPSYLVEGLRLLPPRTTAQTAVGLWVYLEAEPTIGWLGGDVEVTSGEPANTGEFGWTVVYFDPADGLPHVHVAAAEVKPTMGDLSIDKRALIAALPDGVYPAGAVSLFSGQTAVTPSNSRYEDMRTLPNRKQIEMSQILTDSAGNVLSDSNGNIVMGA